MTRLEEILARTRDFEKPIELKPTRSPLQKVHIYDIHAIMPFVMDAIDTVNNYDVWIGKQLLTDLTPVQTLSILGQVKNQLMREVNEVQEEMDRIERLEMDIDDPRIGELWPVYYELKVRERTKR